MAKAPAKQEEPVAHAKSSKKFLIIIIAVVLLVVVLGGGAAFILLKKKGDSEEGDGEHAKKPAEKSAKHEVLPVFVRLEPFTVKMQADADKPEQYLQLVPELKVLDVTVSEKIKVYMPEIRHKMLLLLSSKKPSELSTPQGVDKLSVDLRNQVNLIVDGEQKAAPPADGKPRAEDSVQSVLFTSFIIQ